MTVCVFLVLAGIFIFTSASLGLLARDGVSMGNLIASQILAIAVGTIAAIIAVRIPPEFWNKYAFYIFIASLIATFLVFVPGIGVEHGGAHRWLNLGPLPSVQPSELLKFAFVLYYAAWCAALQKRIHLFRYAAFPLVLLVGIAGIPLILQPDYGTIIIIGVTGFSMLIVAGARIRHVMALALAAFALLALVVFTVPYINTRVMTFFNPNRDPLGASYQIRQSLIAIGSGHITGRGFGQSIQKFSFLPEPVGDSIFAVFAEEWGFVGAIALLSLFIVFLSRGYRIAMHAPRVFSRIAVVGFITSIVIQSFMNIGSMLNVMPLTGDPLVFVSQGGTSMVMALLAVGIILSVSKTLPTKT